MPKYRNDITAAYLRERLSYDPISGVFTWRITASPKAVAGSAAGSLHRNGYLRIRIDGKDYLAHRLAWLHVTGNWPSEEIDHRSGVRSENRFANLREATTAQNNQNRKRPSTNKSGYLGVSWRKTEGKWLAQIKVQGKKIFLGCFDSAESAAAAYLDAKTIRHGFQPVPRETPSPCP